MVSTTEVAKHAGVSQTTVSRVLNRPEQVRKETYDKVMQALAELDYGNSAQPAKEEVVSSRDVLVLLAKDSPAESFDTFRELAEQAQAFGYHAVGRFLTGAETAKDIQGFANQVAGTVSIGELPAGISEQLRGTGQAFRQVEAVPATESFDGHQAAYLATSHLASENHEQIGWVGADREDSGERLQGYYEALAHHQLKLRKKRIHTPHNPGDFDALAAGLRTFQKPTSAFVAASYEDAVQLVDALESAGHKVPKEVSVIAIGAPKESAPTVKVTTVKPVHAEQSIAQQVMQQLTQQLDGKAVETDASAQELQIDNQKTVKAFKTKQQVKTTSKSKS
ncbi:LacI family DNA-binding transcriptional regulator [Planococcus sp. ISL-109]|uniref:LacI family DNA-binding transcriptional regulator n=1 Tax=Planococcus sp. ISL-109 TaxID=2819166 RepID=UPI001BEC90C4|nr:LacI family DNA-binding transcriptional regulator [Planococcus sp. ISL-109]MBT2582163.1 LacI family DNA-binding transcriptional regulator [Planococcus sp. ISL-109]